MNSGDSKRSSQISIALCCAWAAALLALTGAGTTAKAADEEGTTPNRLASRASRILEAHRAQREFPGAVMAVHDPSGESALVSSGTTAAIDGSPAVDTNVPWFIGSVTKTYVAVVVLQLAQEEKLDLDRSIELWFPDLPNASQITVRQLLQHTGGLNEYIETKTVLEDAKRPWLPEELIAVAVALGPLAEPGAGHHYSNTNYIVLGEIIERVTSRLWYAEVRSRILEPLGMTRTGYPDEEGALQVGPGHGTENSVFVDYSSRWHHSVGGAAGAMYSTASDMLRFIRALRDGSLLDQQRSVEMRTFVPAENYGYIRHEYGLGLEKYVLNDLTLYGHLGTASAHSSFIGFDPESRVAAAVLTNCDCAEPPPFMTAEIIGELTNRDITPPPMPSASFGYTYFPYAKLEDSDNKTVGKVQITQFDASVAQTHVFNRGKTRVTGSLDYQRLEFDYRDFGTRVPLQSVQSISLGLTLVQRLTDSWGLLLIASSGYADDFEGEASTDAVTFDLIGAATYRFSKNLEVGLGFAGTSILGEFQPLPVGSIDWQISEELSFNAILPVNAVLTWVPLDRLGLRAGFKLDGNNFHGDKDRYDVQNPQVNYSAMTAELAARWYFLPWLHVTAHGGYTINRRFEFSDGRSNVKNGKFDLNNDGVLGIQIGIGD
ncbi:MAG: serine hydrolase [Deltaproteobacteria bacterium]|nr:serine hydrolase [Deltaproteobacteria bacterium]MBW2722830.1 serine hydrolase [Deltaproteobacteria bacterium]